MTLDWISGLETSYPAKTTDPFPTEPQTAAEPWPSLCRRFLYGGEMQISRREVLVGSAALAASPSFALVHRDKESKNMYGLIGKLSTAPNRRDDLIAILRES